MQTKRTVLVSSTGWTLQEFDKLLTDEEVLDYVKHNYETSNWKTESILRLVYQPEINPPQTYIEVKDMQTGKVSFVAFIRVRE